MQSKVVIVTGGAGGQGLSEAQLLAREGASVIITDLSDKGEAAAKAIGNGAIFFKHDVSEAHGWARLMDLVMSRYGRLDALVNNAALYVPQTLLNTSEELWERHYRVNQLGTFLGMKAAADIMKNNGGGSIINVSSMVGMRGTAGVFAYASTKWAVRGMSKLAATELGPLGIRVNSVFPGAIDTPMLGDGARTEAFIDSVPLRRLGVPEDMANLVLFLASDRSTYITGAEIIVTGGL